MKPVKSRIQKLVEALRSGKYKPGRHALRNGDEFCCLGVACDIYRKEKGGRWVKRGDEAFYFKGQRQFLPDLVKNWYGFESKNPLINILEDFSRPVTCSTANDGGFSFESIAQGLENTFLRPKRGRKGRL